MWTEALGLHSNLLVPYVATLPVDQAIKVVSDHIGSRWKELARKLKFTRTTIDAVQHNNLLNLLEQIHDFFHRWKQRDGREATLEELVEGLKATKLQDCLSELESNGLIPKGTFACTSCTNTVVHSEVHVRRDNILSEPEAQLSLHKPVAMKARIGLKRKLINRAIPWLSTHLLVSRKWARLCFQVNRPSTSGVDSGPGYSYCLLSSPAGF